MRKPFLLLVAVSALVLLVALGSLAANQGGTCDDNCSGNGECLQDVNGVPFCLCNQTFTGRTCGCNNTLVGDECNIFPDCNHEMNPVTKEVCNICKECAQGTGPACCQAEYEESCPTGCQDDYLLVDIFDIKTRAYEACHLPQDECINNDLCLSEERFHCYPHPNNTCQALSPSECSGTNGCYLDVMCYGDEVCSGFNRVFPSENRRGLCLSTPGCSYGQSCQPNCFEGTPDACSSKPECIVANHTECLGVCDGIFEVLDCVMTSGCFYNYYYGGCQISQNNTIPTSPCPYFPSSIVCSRWGDCSNQGCEDDDLLVEYCCGVGLLDQDPECLTAGIQCPNPCGGDINLPEGDLSIFQGVFRAMDSYTGQQEAYFIFEGNQFKYIRGNRTLEGNMGFDQGASELVLMALGENIIIVCHVETFFGLTIYLGNPNGCAKGTNILNYGAYALEQAPLCGVPVDVCPQVDNCTTHGSFSCHARNESLCEGQDVGTCDSALGCVWNQGCRPKDARGGSYCYDKKDKPDCEMDTICEWAGICANTCYEQGFATCTGNCEWKAETRCMVDDCSILGSDREACDQYDTFCTYNRFAEECVDSSRRFNTTASCPFGSEDACKLYYVCDTSLEGVHNPEACAELNHQYCCRDGLFSGDPICSNMTLSCLDGCEFGEEISFNTDLNGLWVSAYDENYSRTIVYINFPNISITDSEMSLQGTVTPYEGMLLVSFSGNLSQTFGRLFCTILEPGYAHFSLDGGSCLPPQDDPKGFTQQDTTVCALENDLCTLVDHCEIKPLASCAHAGNCNEQSCTGMCYETYKCEGQGCELYAQNYDICTMNQGCIWKTYCEPQIGVCDIGVSSCLESGCAIVSTPQCGLKDCSQLDHEICANSGVCTYDPNLQKCFDTIALANCTVANSTQCKDFKSWCCSEGLFEGDANCSELRSLERLDCMKDCSGYFESTCDPALVGRWAPIDHPFDPEILRIYPNWTAVLHHDQETYRGTLVCGDYLGLKLDDLGTFVKMSLQTGSEEAFMFKGVACMMEQSSPVYVVNVERTCHLPSSDCNVGSCSLGTVTQCEAIEGHACPQTEDFQTCGANPNCQLNFVCSGPSNCEEKTNEYECQSMGICQFNYTCLPACAYKSESDCESLPEYCLWSSQERCLANCSSFQYEDSYCGKSSGCISDWMECRPAPERLPDRQLSCPFTSSAYCSEFFEACPYEESLTSGAGCIDLMTEICCYVGFTYGEPICVQFLEGKTCPIEGTEPCTVPTGSCSELNGLWDLQTPPRKRANPVELPPSQRVAIFQNTIALFNQFPSKTNSITGQIQCRDGEYEITIPANITIRGVYGSFQEPDPATNMALNSVFSEIAPSEGCDPQPNMRLSRENTVTRDLGLCRIRNQTELGLCAQFPHCRLSTTPVCLPSGSASYEGSPCLQKESKSDCEALAGNCTWTEQRCVIRDCSSLPLGGACTEDSGCVSRETCATSPRAYSTKCPFRSPEICDAWEKCLPESMQYNPSACTALKRSGCCTAPHFDRPALCQTLEFPTAGPFPAPSQCQMALLCEQATPTPVACPDIVFRGPWRQMSSTLEGHTYTLAFDPSRTGTLSRVRGENLATLENFYFDIACSGNTSQTFNVYMTLQGTQSGYMMYGKVYVPGSFVSGNNISNYQLVIETADRCVSQGAPFDIRLFKDPPAQTNPNNCTNPISVAFTTTYSGPVSRSFTIFAPVTIRPCLTTAPALTYRWTVTPATSLFPSPVNTSSLSVPAQRLSPGTYNISLSVGHGASRLNATTRLTILASPPVIRVSPSGASHVVSVRRPFTLNATASFSPDQVQGGPAIPVQCSWTCAYTDPNLTCPAINLNTCALSFAANTLVENQSLVFGLTVTALGASTQAQITVQTLTEVVAELDIQVRGLSPTGFVNGAGAVRIQATVRRSTTVNDTSLLALTWESLASPETFSLDLGNSSLLLTPNNTFNLVIRPNVLLPGKPYRFRLTASDGIGIGRSEIQFSIYEPPSGGLFVVDPAEGTFGTTTFSMSALFWRDPSGTSNSYLLYNFAVKEAGKDLYFLRQRPTDAADLETTLLPPGNLILYAFIYSPFGVTKCEGVNVTVARNETQTKLEEAAALSTQLDSALTVQDQNSILQIVVILARLLNDFSNLENPTPEQLEALVHFRAQLVQAISVVAELTSLGEEDAQQLIPTLNEIARNANQIDRETLSLLLSLTTTLAQIAGPAAEQFLEVLSTLLAAIRLVTQEGDGQNQARDQVEQLLSSLNSFFSSYTSQSLCNEDAQTLEAENFQLEGQARSSFSGFSQGVFSLGPEFSLGGDSSSLGDSSCFRYQFVGSSGNPYDWQPNTTFTPKRDVVSFDFYDSDGGEVVVANLSSGASISVRFENFASMNITFEEAKCIYWNPASEDWSDEGCVGLLEGEGEDAVFVCVCTHLTSFSLGTVSVSFNVIDHTKPISLDQLLTTRGGVLSLATVIVLMVLYIILFIFALIMDRKDRAKERVPEHAELRDFIDKFTSLYGRKVPAAVLETRCLDEWAKVYEVNRGNGKDYKPGFWSILRINLKDGFRQQHLYISVFFRPIQGYTRPQRITVIFSILLCSLCVSAFLFQYDENQEVSIGARIVSAIISSAIVFVPTTIHGFLFRKCARRGVKHRYIEDLTVADYEKMDIELDKIEKRNWFQKTFVDFHLPWWCSCILYTTGYIAYAFCIYTSLLYGISFRDDKANAFYQSYLLSIALSLFVLQTAKAFVGGLFATLTSGVVSVALLAGLATGQMFAMQ